jgi:succinate dehydrogenase/fumarate reductase flavoprotein subunit
MVQGGYNAVLHPSDSLDQHFHDTIEGGAYLNDQELAWTLIATAPERIRELENRMGCFFDRNPDGTIHQKAFAGQSFDRTVHRGDLTGIEIMTRLMEQVWRRSIPTLEAHRAIELLPIPGGHSVACSTVFGGIAGDRMAAYIAGKKTPEVADAQVHAVIARIMAPFDRPSGEDVYILRDDLKALMREKAGLVRNASDLKSAQNAWAILRERAQHVCVSGSPRFNPEWQEWLNLDSLLAVSNMIVASALQRKESRGAHFRSDYPEADNSYYLQNIYLQRQGEGMRLWLTPVQFTRLRSTAPVTPGLDQTYLAQE